MLLLYNDVRRSYQNENIIETAVVMPTYDCSNKLKSFLGKCNAQTHKGCMTLSSHKTHFYT